MPDRFGVPVVTCLRAFFVARKAAGALSARHSLLPLIDEGVMLMHNSGKSCRENAVARHCEERSDEAIQTVVSETFWIASLRSQ
jgi:hypothetical protein